MENLQKEPSTGNTPSRRTYEPAFVRALFDAIAPRYDFLNHLLSFSQDVHWRTKAIDLLVPYKPRTVLDLATGTADLAIEAVRLRPLEIRGIDLSRKMLELGREKIARMGLHSIITLEEGSAERLRFTDRSFDAVTVAFGIRNFSDLQSGLAEIHRVLRPGGVAVILEFSRPRRTPARQIYGFYFRKILPFVGGLVSGSPEAYDYLPSTVEEFPDSEDLISHLLGVGFTRPQMFPMTFEIAAIYLAEKSISPLPPDDRSL